MHAQRHAKLFAKSLDQKLYNMILQDRSNYGRDMINLYSMCRQLEYEVILSKKNTDTYDNLARNFMKDTKFIYLQDKQDKIEIPRRPDSDKLWPIMTLDFSNMRALETAFMLCFESIGKHCYGPERVSIPFDSQFRTKFTTLFNGL